MKRRELIRQLDRAGCVLKRRGSRHDIYSNPAANRCAPVPRHTEVPDSRDKIRTRRRPVRKPVAAARRVPDRRTHLYRPPEEAAESFPDVHGLPLQSREDWLMLADQRRTDYDPLIVANSPRRVIAATPPDTCVQWTNRPDAAIVADSDVFTRRNEIQCGRRLNGILMSLINKSIVLPAPVAIHYHRKAATAKAASSSSGESAPNCLTSLSSRPTKAAQSR